MPCQSYVLTVISRNIYEVDYYHIFIILTHLGYYLKDVFAVTKINMRASQVIYPNLHSSVNFKVKTISKSCFADREGSSIINDIL